MKMIVGVSVEDEYPLNQEINKELSQPEYNELRLHFHNLCHPC